MHGRNTETKKNIQKMGKKDEKKGIKKPSTQIYAVAIKTSVSLSLPLSFPPPLINLKRPKQTTRNSQN